MSLKEDSYHFRLTDVVEKKEDRQLTFQYRFFKKGVVGYWA